VLDAHVAGDLPAEAAAPGRARPAPHERVRGRDAGAAGARPAVPAAPAEAPAPAAPDLPRMSASEAATLALLEPAAA
jgi:hypothetical protein